MIRSVRLVRRYGLLVGAGLLVEGGILLALDLLHVAPGDTRHNALHVVWGLVLLGLLSVRKDARWTILVVAGFGVFYTTLAILGVVSSQPFGLQLGPGENAFHFIVGPFALIFSAVAWNQLSSSSASSADSVSSATSGRRTSGG